MEEPKVGDRVVGDRAHVLDLGISTDGEIILTMRDGENCLFFCLSLEKAVDLAHAVLGFTIQQMKDDSAATTLDETHPDGNA